MYALSIQQIKVTHLECFAALLTHLTVGEGGPTDNHHHKVIFKLETPRDNYSVGVKEMFKRRCSVSGHSTKDAK